MRRFSAVCMVVLGMCFTAMGALYVATTGTVSGSGAISDPTVISEALKRIAAGDTIFVRGGVYSSSVQITIEATNSGSVNTLKHLFAYGNEKPVFDFSTQPYGTTSNARGLQINGNFWHIRGLEIVGSADNGVYIAGSNSIVELCKIHGNRDSGLQLGRYATEALSSDWPSNNLILNCESYDNYDSPPGGGENADGFACKLTTGNGNIFRGCVSHHNIDDGWDLYTKTETGAIGPVVLDQCIAYSNGTLTNGFSNPNGDRNGFKLGGEKIEVAHRVTRCVAFGNGKNGFTWNSNPGALFLANNLGLNNAEGNFIFGDNATPTKAVFTNNVSFWTVSTSAMTDKYKGTDVASSNCFWDKSKSQPSINAKGLIVTAADFVQSLQLPNIIRKADGSLDFSVFALSQGSDLVNAGVVPTGTLLFDPALYYVGNPDLGVYELGGTTKVRNDSFQSEARALLSGQCIVGLVPHRESSQISCFYVNGQSGATIRNKSVRSVFIY